MRTRAVALILSSLAAACTQTQAAETEADPTRVPPQQAPARFGFGRAADPAPR